MEDREDKEEDEDGDGGGRKGGDARTSNNTMRKMTMIMRVCIRYGSGSGGRCGRGRIGEMGGDARIIHTTDGDEEGDNQEDERDDGHED